VSGIDIVLRRAERFPLSGTILDSQGAPAASTRLVLVRGRSSIVTNLPVATDANGRFHSRHWKPTPTGCLSKWPLAGLMSVNGARSSADVPITVAGRVPSISR
jgi:hypothetical protein